MFIYQPGAPPRAYVGHIVQWDGDTKQQKTAWFVGQERRWIPTIAIYNCLKGRGAPGPDVLAAQKLDEYQDLTGQWITGPSDPVARNSRDLVQADPGSVLLTATRGGTGSRRRRGVTSLRLRRRLLQQWPDLRLTRRHTVRRPERRQLLTRAGDEGRRRAGRLPAQLTTESLIRADK